MFATRPHATVVLGFVSVLLAATAGSAVAGPPTPPRPETVVSLSEGPWPPTAGVLAADPSEVAAPGITAARTATQCPAAPYGVNHYAPGTGKTVALTFDDGPGVTTAAILSILQQNGVPATFFNLGVNSTVRPTLVRSEAVTGQVLGNHTWSHPRMPTLSSTAQASELDRASAEQTLLTGIAPCVFRPPYGEYNATTLSLAQQRHMAVWNWSVDTEDWKAGTSTSSYWVDRIVTRATAGGLQHPVVLMHNPPAGIPATVSALPRIIAYYRSQGYKFVDLRGGSGMRAPTPAAAATSDGLHLFVRSTTGSVSERTLRGSVWSGWTSLGGAVVGGPAAAATGSATTAVAAIGTDNSVYLNSVSDPGTSSAWANLGGFATSRPAFVTTPGLGEIVVIRGADGQAYLRQRTGTQWGNWQSLGGLLAPVAPAAAVTANGALTVAVVGADNAMWVRTRSSAGVWSIWHPVSGAIDADLALSTTADRTRLVAVVRGSGNQAGFVSVSNPDVTSWTGWGNLGGILASGPAVTVNGSALEVFAVGTDNRIYRNSATDGTQVTGWTGWRLVP
ncbi:peptidoglycan/xylan/chitin deacetylase (PgdA/CDA1 family) [Kribbella voronezhensis]|uniref:Peptidoglycan/xylan/chitin deacetylase (PgdA/CDA1 family) n=1 Tax=Kribbella voronezhensis TaxID=2512212 RepID=A0A4R7T0I4_9ACTN|nr:polysaccharide deacetylase family protein [Kribbella voronezhensis]TDU84348.1 peptidoglycan/xylan/chitin deacetylase (PgdA/CDA1 family) [Kribbella voronezhensis]